MLLLIALSAHLIVGTALCVAVRASVGPAEDALQYVLLAFGWQVLIAGVMFEVAREIRAERRDREKAAAYLVRGSADELR